MKSLLLLSYLEIIAGGNQVYMLTSLIEHVVTSPVSALKKQWEVLRLYKVAWEPYGRMLYMGW